MPTRERDDPRAPPVQEDEFGVLEADAGNTLVGVAPIVDEARPAPGTILEERYELGDLLGEGGMGFVLSARHVILGSRLAVKVLRRELTREPEMVERFRREARAASAIGHPNIVEVRDFGTLPAQDGVPGASYFVMEHLEGQSLADAIAADGPFSVERAIDVVRQMADALGAAHAHGIIHRDVKPDNVILTVRAGRPDHVKILDFGIAKLDSAVRLSGAFRVLGTPAYMSPEQASGRPVDARTDVYALGIVLYELLAGEVPFEDPRILEVLRMQVAVEAPSILLRRPDVPDVIATTLARCLAKEPSERPASMQEFLALLAPFAATRSNEFRRASMPTTLDAPPSVDPGGVVEEMRPITRSGSTAIAATRLSLPRPSTPSVPGPSGRTAPARAVAPVDPVTTAPKAPRQASLDLRWLAAGAIVLLAVGLFAVLIGVVVERRTAATAAELAATSPPTLVAEPPPVPRAALEAPAAPSASSSAASASVGSPAPHGSGGSEPSPHATHGAHAHTDGTPGPLSGAPAVPTEQVLLEPSPSEPPSAPPSDPAASGSRPTEQVIDPWN